ncbi:RIC1-domain-containing protein [Pluteus cervinus]|uniref:RIC1-domain-containing protein n=1 Tax=Pluteus cervinus TaxID=181527 RepID=A0ACD3BF61_9AGAR|nr:RIC1-domain-containing protein [Pluteus cervinus]
MYFPTSAAVQLSTVPALPNLPPEPVAYLAPSPRKSLFCTVTRNGIAVWRVRPAAVLAFLTRTPTSIIDHGENRIAHWSPDGTKIVIQTSESFLVLISVEYRPDESVYKVPPLPPTAQRNFLAGPGEALPLQSISLQFEGVIRIEGTLLSVSPRKHFILFSTKNPPVVQRIPWPLDDEGEADGAGKPKMRYRGFDSWSINDEEFPWLVEPEVAVETILYSRTTGVETWITTDGRAYFVTLHEHTGTGGVETEDGSTQVEHRQSEDDPNSELTLTWHGTCVHNFETPKWVQKQKQVDPSDIIADRKVYEEVRRAVTIAINGKFSMIATGTQSGELAFTNFPSQEGVTPKSQIVQIPNPYKRPTGAVCSMEWSSDGYVLAVAWQYGWGIISVGGRCLAGCFGVEDVVDEDRFQDAYMFGVRNLFWAPGNFELFVLAQSTPKKVDGQLFVIPFAKSATTGQHSPDNTRYAFLQMDDRALIYRGADQPDMSVINPESDVWQHIKIPQSYLATNWPIRYSSLSSDGRLIAVAGRRGLIHYSSTSGRWKLFSDEYQEQAFSVRGGLLWFHHVLVAAVEISKSYQIRLYSRDMELSNQNVLHREQLTAPVVILSLVDNSLLVYTADNTLYHFLIVPTADTIKLHLCGSITFNGIIMAPTAVRMLSWMIPSTQKQLGDPVDDLAVATVLMVVGGQLILLRPRKSGNHEVKYDMQIFADRIEFCWIHLRGIAALENSLWAYDGQGMRVWLNALAIEAPQTKDQEDVQQDVKESVNIPLDFYPLSVLMDKGIIIGAEHEAATRSNLPFVMFRHATSSHLFLHHVLLFILSNRQVREAVVLASHYKDLVYFAHALEILLHTVVESEATLDSEEVESDTPLDPVLPTVVEFLDHFDSALDVVVGCARKTELTRWRRLFDIVGNPKALFEICLASNRLKTAGSYLLVLHNLEQLDENNADAVRLLRSAVDGKDWQLCRELLRFLHSIDDTGAALRDALKQTNVINLELENELQEEQ